MRKRNGTFIIITLLALLLTSCEKLVEYGEGRYICENDELTYLEGYNGIYIHWSEDVTPEQQSVIRNIVANMVPVAGGSFLMGAQSAHPTDNNYDASALDDESPIHMVTLRDFYIGKYEVTQKEWEIITGTKAEWTSSYGLGDLYPAYNINYNDAKTFITRLNDLTGSHFRLPTEAEWEFAAHGGRNSNHYTYCGSNFIQEVAWYKENGNNSSHEIGTKFSNELGLYDMSGNVCEWCSDYYGEYSPISQTNPTGPASGGDCVVRGGSYCYLANHARCTARDFFYAEGHSIGIGFRLALSE